MVTAALRKRLSLLAVPAVDAPMRGMAPKLSIGVTPKPASDLSLYYVYPGTFVPGTPLKTMTIRRLKTPFELPRA